MDADDRALLAAGVGAALDPDAAAVTNDRVLRDLGWHDMLTTEPIDAVAVVFGELGRLAARSTVIDDVVGVALGRPPGRAIVHPRWGGAELPDPDGPASDGVAGARITTAPDADVLCRGGIATVGTLGIAIAERDGDRELGRVSWGGPSETFTSLTDATLDAAITAARLAVAHQLRGLASGMLTLARGHALERTQFGRRIGSFQAVRHRLAETHVAIEGATAALDAAVEDPSAITVDLARVLAGRAALEAGRQCQQVLAGIGFTREHDFHRHLFAAIELDGLYGTTASLTRQLGRDLIATRAVPRTVEL